MLNESVPNLRTSKTFKSKKKSFVPISLPSVVQEETPQKSTIKRKKKDQSVERKHHNSEIIQEEQVQKPIESSEELLNEVERQIGIINQRTPDKSSTGAYLKEGLNDSTPSSIKRHAVESHRQQNQILAISPLRRSKNASLEKLARKSISPEQLQPKPSPQQSRAGTKQSIHQSTTSSFKDNRPLSVVMPPDVLIKQTCTPLRRKLHAGIKQSQESKNLDDQDYDELSDTYTNFSKSSKKKSSTKKRKMSRSTSPMPQHEKKKSSAKHVRSSKVRMHEMGTQYSPTYSQEAFNPLERA